MRQHQKNLKTGKGIPLILLLPLALFCTGCSVDEGLREGMNDGLSAALSAVIQAPVNYALDQTFDEP